MSVESGSYISDLNESWPNATDLVNEGDDHLRLIKQLIKQTFPGLNKPVGYGAATDAGAGNYLLTLSNGPSSYVDGMVVFVKWPVTNSGAVTLNVNSLGAKSVVSAKGNALVGGELIGGNWDWVQYDVSSTTFKLIGNRGEEIVKGGQTGAVSFGSNTTTTNLRAHNVDAVDINAAGDTVLRIRAGAAPVEGGEIELFDINNTDFWVIDNNGSNLLRIYHSLNTSNHIQFNRSTGKLGVVNGANNIYLSPNVDADAYTLDQCIKGTWTPTLGRDGIAPSLTYLIQSGWYQKIGKIVHVGFVLKIYTISSQGSGYWRIGGLPYIIAGQANTGAAIGYHPFESSIDAVSGIVSSSYIYIVKGGVVDLNLTAINNRTLTGVTSYLVE